MVGRVNREYLLFYRLLVSVAQPAEERWSWGMGMLADCFMYQTVPTWQAVASHYGMTGLVWMGVIGHGHRKVQELGEGQTRLTRSGLGSSFSGRITQLNGCEPCHGLPTRKPRSLSDHRSAFSKVAPGVQGPRGSPGENSAGLRNAQISPEGPQLQGAHGKGDGPFQALETCKAVTYKFNHRSRTIVID